MHRDIDDTPQQLVAMSNVHNAVRISFEREIPADAEASLRGLEEVADVIGNTGTNYLTVLPVDGVSIVRQVTHLARDEGWDIEEVFVEAGQLDEVFRRITTQPASLQDGALT